VDKDGVMANEQQTPSAEFLVEPYKLRVDYRKYLGSLLMQMTGGVVAIFTILIGLLGGKSPNVLRFGLGFGSISFGLLAYTSYRLRCNERLCSVQMHQIETDLKKRRYESVIWPIEEGRGARIVFIVFLCLLAGSLGYLCYRG
jgi:hypothetical protein